MSIVVRINCDQTYADGRCGESSWPAYTVDAAERVAELRGWSIHPATASTPARHLCPTHARATPTTRRTRIP